MSNYKTVFFTLGILQIILGVFMFIPIIFQFIYSEIDSSFFGASIVTIIFGILFFLSNLDHDKKLTLQQAFLLTALSWLSIAIHYHYDKRLDDGSTVLCRVFLYPMIVEKLKRGWKESKQRKRHWFSPKKASRLVEEEELSIVLNDLSSKSDKLAVMKKLRKAA